MVANTAWLPTFMSNSGPGFIIGLILLLVIWSTNIAMMAMADHAKVNWLEVLCIRLPISIYAGWTTAATVLNGIYVFKFYPSALKFFTDIMLEEYWGVLILWCTFTLVNVISIEERNPMYGSVLVWVASAIFDKTANLKPGNTMIWLHSLVILIC